MSTVVNEMVTVRCLVGGRDRVDQELDQSSVSRYVPSFCCRLRIGQIVVDQGLAEGANVGL